MRETPTVTISYHDAAAFRTELRRFLHRSEEAARQVGITPGQHMLLLQIAGSDEEQTTVSELVEKLSLTQSAVTELVQRAELAGLVARQTSPSDGRVAHLRLTDLGAESLERVHSMLGPERAQLRRMIDRLERN